MLLRDQLNRRPRRAVLGGATKALVAEAHSQAAAGRYDLATASIERALRIEPANPLLWIELGRVKQAEGNRVQAENMVRKALSLAEGDAATQALARELLANVRKPASGRR
jgi:Flp pilus assembly protein TadD